MFLNYTNLFRAYSFLTILEFYSSVGADNLDCEDVIAPITTKENFVPFRSCTFENDRSEFLASKKRTAANAFYTARDGYTREVNA